ncbi:IS3 family transposase [Ralstonia pseudosolanacearum]|uniref:IS3 family transposase n=1 Tax=Ralstonia pseudosolanacearum TaxID=1310165 RepID=UPI0009B8FADA|nr:IS3 family transposase [Ralstonia pseudosolanacearum]MDO3529983.1 IS3 family transposase [Ralstonia pseudosolanacearum]MDO3549742.1 IS3 family transposase [Ralstonia pseudosolanacearum]MDO3559400.1 IS3 family transposase [Ralstonia pseudosolanacearum]MDO3578505.1 IS3 family transposase [Ralstonia pseudosolanacearum]MDO3584418.1 IS3 family transposase [Ralstonia pseudosolanacearum]
MEVLTGPERRRRWSVEEKFAMVRESFEPGKTVSMVARQHGVNPNQVFHWRKLYQDGSLSAVSAGEEVVPASELAEALKQVRELQRMLGKKTMENEILREAVEYGRAKKWIARSPSLQGGRPVKQVCEVLGVARSNVAAMRTRPADWRDGRTARQTDDAGLMDEIRHVIADLPSYGYRRVWGRLWRERASRCEALINAKRVYQVMRGHGLLLERRPTPPRPRRWHDGKVAAAKSNQRWCSDGFEFRCDNGEPLRVTFALDCCDREAMSWVATTGGYSGDVVCDVMLAAVEQRFGNVPKAPAEIEWLTDNGSGYIAGKTREFATDIGLKPLTTPVCSPQSNGMAESFVKTMKRDYVAFMPKPDAATAARNLAIAFEHYNEQHPHSALKYRSPREFRRRTESSIQV